jgi:hypothetical protein
MILVFIVGAVIEVMNILWFLEDKYLK